MLEFKKLHPDAIVPQRAHDSDAGMDVYTIEDIRIPARGDVLTGLGLACKFPKGHALLVYNKSGRATKLKLDKGAEVIDDVFYVWKSRFGLHSTMLKSGRRMLTGLKKEDVINMTRWHLKCEQDGTLDQYTRVVNNGVVGGKL